MIKIKSILVKSKSEFKCLTDGLFEDEQDCQMYYECIWIGTAFEKQEHIKCADKLIYNPRKHRCDNVFEFESQFAKGIQTGEELLEFMRFRNCIGSKNLINDMYEVQNFDKTSSSPTTNYFNQIIPEEKINTTIARILSVTNLTQTTTNSNALNKTDDFDSLFLMEDEKVYFGRKLYFDSSNNKTIKNETEDALKQEPFKNENDLSVFGTEKKRTFMGTFNKNKNKSKKFKVLMRKTILEANLDQLILQKKIFQMKQVLIRLKNVNFCL